MRSKKAFVLTLTAIGFGILYWSWPFSGEDDFRLYRKRPQEELKTPYTSRAEIDKKSSAKKEREPAQEGGSEISASSERALNPDEDQRGGDKKAFKNIDKNKYANNLKRPIISSDYEDENGNRYLLLEDYYAVKRTTDNYNDFPGAIANSGYLLLKGAPAPADRVRVMKNLETGNYAVFTGILKVRLKDMAYMDEVVRDCQCRISESYERLKAVFFEFDGYNETISAHKKLLEDPMVITSEVELLEGQRSAR